AERTDLAEAVIAQLAQVGIRVKTNSLAGTVFNDRWVKKLMSPLYFETWNTFTDPATLNTLAGCKGLLSNICNTEAQPFLDTGGATLDQAQRDTAYKQAAAAFGKDPFAIYLDAKNTLTAVSKKVQG